jgi:hypothetical protein
MGRIERGGGDGGEPVRSPARSAIIGRLHGLANMRPTMVVGRAAANRRDGPEADMAASRNFYPPRRLP